MAHSFHFRWQVTCHEHLRKVAATKHLLLVYFVFLDVVRHRASRSELQILQQPLILRIGALLLTIFAICLHLLVACVQVVFDVSFKILLSVLYQL